MDQERVNQLTGYLKKLFTGFFASFLSEEQTAESIFLSCAGLVETVGDVKARALITGLVPDDEFQKVLNLCKKHVSTYTEKDKEEITKLLGRLAQSRNLLTKGEWFEQIDTRAARKAEQDLLDLLNSIVRAETHRAGVLFLLEGMEVEDIFSAKSPSISRKAIVRSVLSFTRTALERYVKSNKGCLPDGYENLWPVVEARKMYDETEGRIKAGEEAKAKLIKAIKVAGGEKILVPLQDQQNLVLTYKGEELFTELLARQLIDTDPEERKAWWLQARKELAREIQAEEAAATQPS